MKTILKMEDFINDESVEITVKDICKKKEIGFDECIKDLIVKAYKFQTNFDNTIKGYVGERDFDIINKMYIDGMTFKGCADLEGVSSTRIRQILCRGVRNMRIRLKIYLKQVEKGDNI